MKNHSIFILLGALLLIRGSLPAQTAPATSGGGGSNPYDLLGRVLAPIATVFCPTGSRAEGSPQKPQAFTAKLILQEMTGLPSELVGAHAELAVEPPDRFLIRVPFAGQPTTLCRKGQEIWIAPKAALLALPFQPAANATGASGAPSEPKKKGKKKKDWTIAPLTLPFPPQQLAFLPVLFTVHDAGEVNGLRFLDARFMPDLARRLGLEDWSARLYVKPGQGEPGKSRPQLAGVEIARPGWHLIVRVESIEYLRDLPPATWEPAAGDAVRMEGPMARQWLEALGKQVNPTPASQP